jgi:nitrile hydratase subunit beta
MNGGQDLGGMQGFGPVRPEPDEPWFHAEWERRVFGMALTMGATGTWTLDGARHARESLPPGEYLTSSYYRIWFRALESQVVRHGLVSDAEIAQGAALAPPAPVRRVLAAADVPVLVARGNPAAREGSAPARFKVGDTMRGRNAHPTGHTRLPRYARGKRGVIEAVDGVFVLPDASARGEEAPQWMYSVRFAAQELWGEEADPTTSVTLSAWESYLEPAGA